MWFFFFKLTPNVTGNAILWFMTKFFSRKSDANVSGIPYSDSVVDYS